MDDWTIYEDPNVLPPMCAYKECYAEAPWCDPWNTNYYCEVHKKVVTGLMETEL